MAQSALTYASKSQKDEKSPFSNLTMKENVWKKNDQKSAKQVNVNMLHENKYR